MNVVKGELIVVGPLAHGQLYHSKKLLDSLGVPYEVQEITPNGSITELRGDGFVIRIEKGMKESERG